MTLDDPHRVVPSRVTGSPSNRTPGDLLFHPIALVALVMVILNDQVLKVRYPSAFTGKLSDFAGLIYFPLFAVATFEALRWVLRRRPWQLGTRSVIAISVTVGTAFTLIKLSSPAADFYREHLALLLWPAYALGDLLQGRGLPGVRVVGLVQDPTDLIALPALLLAVWVAKRVMVDSNDPS
ncbi:MAG: hypothetical protein WCJ04_09790 [Actinomycetes bacterium]